MNHSSSSPATGIPVLSFWNRLFMREQTGAHFLHYLHRGKDTTITVKDLYAQASCIAAYLRLQDIRPGTPVAVASWNGPFQIMVDIALQFIGAVQIPVPQDSTEEALERIMSTFAPQVWFVENEPLLKQLGELRAFKPQLKEIIINDEIEHLDYTKLIAFDRVIEFGKTLWRENQQLMQDTRQGIQTHMTMARAGAANNLKPESLRYQHLIDQSDRIREKLVHLRITTVASVVDPCSLPARMGAWYSPLLEKGNIYLLNQMNEFLDHPHRKKIQALVVHPHLLQKHITDAIATFSGGSWFTRNRMQRTLRLLERKYTLLAMGHRLPAGLKLSLYYLRKIHFGKIQRAIANGPLYFILDQGRLPEATEHLLIETGFKILYLDDIREK